MSEGAAPSEPVTLTREELYGLVWATPISHLAQRFGIAGYQLIAICDRLNVPRPKAGHWQKIAAGKALQQAELSPAGPKTLDSITIRSTESPVPGTAPAVVREAMEKVRRDEIPLKVPERLANPHPMVAKWITEHQRRAKGASLSPQDRRRYRVLDTLFKALDRNGAKISRGDRHELLATVGKERIEFQLRYKMKQVRRPLTADERRWRFAGDKDWRLELEDTDTLLFEIKTWIPNGLKRNWSDSKKGTVESLLDDILATMIAAFPLMTEERERREEAEHQRQMAEQRRQEEVRQQKLNRDRYRRFLEHAGRWRDAQLARQFLAALRGALPEDAAEVAGNSVADWLAWIETSADLYDPLTGDPRDIFKSVAEVTSWTYRDS